MEEKTKFSLKTFLLYLAIEPWTENISLPNFTSIIWVCIITAVILKNELFLWISVGIGIIYFLIKEYKSGSHLNWYRNRKYEKWKDAKKKVKERKEKRFETQNNSEEIEKIIEEKKEENPQNPQKDL